MIDLDKEYTYRGDEVAALFHYPHNHCDCSIVAHIKTTESGYIYTRYFTTEGIHKGSGNYLALKPQKVGVWFNFYRSPNGFFYSGGSYDTEELAKEGKCWKDWVATRHIEVEIP